MKGREGTSVFGPEDMDILQSCFDEIVRRRRLPRPGAESDAVAAALIEAYKRGVTAKKDLIALADLGDRAA
ncbi:hypothetical protein [Mesorhizobium sp. IMUNJ 23232]|uniref:hypothetical protein n=1 Tax=Mesorhizobium sp. IMUNJ 23232 TaxID=3376064 RepID=UPI00379E9868